MASILPRKDRDGNVIRWQARVHKKGYPLQVRTFDRKGRRKPAPSSLKWKWSAGLGPPERSETNDPGRSSGSVCSRSLYPEKSRKIELYRIGTIKADPIGKLTLAKMLG